MQDATEDELFAEQDSIVELRRVEIHAACLAKSRTQRCFDRARVQVHIEAGGTHSERAATQFLSRCVRADRLDVAGCELLSDYVSAAEPMRRSLHRAHAIEAQELGPERRARNLDHL